MVSMTGFSRYKYNDCTYSTATNCADLSTTIGYTDREDIYVTTCRTSYYTEHQQQSYIAEDFIKLLERERRKLKCAHLLINSSQRKIKQKIKIDIIPPIDIINKTMRRRMMGSRN